jgi:hypothetical protein
MLLQQLDGNDDLPARHSASAPSCSGLSPAIAIKRSVQNPEVLNCGDMDHRGQMHPGGATVGGARSRSDREAVQVMLGIDRHQVGRQGGVQPVKAEHSASAPSCSGLSPAIAIKRSVQNPEVLNCGDMVHVLVSGTHDTVHQRSAEVRTMLLQQLDGNDDLPGRRRQGRCLEALVPAEHSEG